MNPRVRVRELRVTLVQSGAEPLPLGLALAQLGVLCLDRRVAQGDVGHETGALLLQLLKWTDPVARDLVAHARELVMRAPDLVTRARELAVHARELLACRRQRRFPLGQPA